MRQLVSFLIHNSRWLLFAIYVVLGCLLLFKNNPYQQSLWLTSAGSVASSVYSAGNSVTSYFNLRQTNEDLNRLNARLQEQLLALQQRNQALEEIVMADTMQLPDSLAGYHFVVAHVISNSVMRPHNYITINRGASDGIQPEMGVIDQNGVVGVVNVVGPHSARIISLLNPNFRLSCKIKNNESFGSLVWDGNDPAYALLEELPRHTKFHTGDTVVTSGYSAVFPPGIPVGIVADGNAPHNENFFTLRVRLLCDFARLSNVQVVLNDYAAEVRQLEKADAPEE